MFLLFSNKKNSSKNFHNMPEIQVESSKFRPEFMTALPALLPQIFHCVAFVAPLLHSLCPCLWPVGGALIYRKVQPKRQNT